MSRRVGQEMLAPIRGNAEAKQQTKPTGRPPPLPLAYPILGILTQMNLESWTSYRYSTEEIKLLATGSTS